MLHLSAAAQTDQHSTRLRFLGLTRPSFPQDWEKAECDLRECVKLIPGFAEGWLRKSDAVHAQQNGRRREILMDYANALAVMDYLAESSSQKAAKSAAKLAKLTIGEDGQLSAKCQ